MNNIITLNNDIRTVFVGDTHGDIETVQSLIKAFPPEENQFVFLGDYVDRGERSKENIDYLLSLRQKFDGKFILLLGNHEARDIIRFSPCDFWESLTPSEELKYNAIFSTFPLAVSVGDCIAVHGALPKINSLADFETIRRTEDDERFYDTIWSDFSESHYADYFSSRTKLKRDRFESGLTSLGKNYLLRGHDPLAPIKQFEGRCLTIFSSNYYRTPQAAILEAGAATPEIYTQISTKNGDIEWNKGEYQAITTGA